MKKRNIILKDSWVDIRIHPNERTLSEIKVTLDQPYNEFQKDLGVINIKINGDTHIQKLYLKEESCQEIKDYFVYSFKDEIDVSNSSVISFRHMEIPQKYEGKCSLRCTLSEVAKIGIDNPLINFQKHLEDFNNTKIVLSAPFGEGKTTFLNYFFEQHEDKYEVFRVFPVNYSVASNEDIFKYIKTDILFQLLGKDIDLEKSTISLKEAFQEYVYLNPKKTIYSFLKNISSLNKETAIISKSIDAFNHFLKPILEYQESQKNDERSSIEGYVKEIYEKEGSLFEDNFYSQLIIELLGQLTEKKTVLVIEDLDRMDPDHVFRILNVISAHYDINNSEGSSVAHNKYGFDKIIIVCDIRNIQSIFEHRYGTNVDFNGYFNKFFSTMPFDYNNTVMIKSFVNNIYLDATVDGKNEYVNALIFLLQIFVENKLISLRELIKIKAHSFKEYMTDRSQLYSHSNEYFKFQKNVFAYSLFYLNDYYSGDLSKSLDSLKNRNLSKISNCDHWARQLIAGLASENGEEITYNDNGEIYVIEREGDYNHSYWQLKKITHTKTKFTDEDFLRLLIEAFKQMKRL